MRGFIAFLLILFVGMLIGYACSAQAGTVKLQPPIVIATATPIGAVPTTAPAPPRQPAAPPAPAPQPSVPCISRTDLERVMTIKQPLFDGGKFAGAQGTLTQDFSVDNNPWVDHIDRDNRAVRSAEAGAVLTIWIKESSRCN